MTKRPNTATGCAAQGPLPHAPDGAAGDPHAPPAAAPAATGPGLPRWWAEPESWRWLAPLALCLLVLVSYLPAMLWGDLVWDDLTMIRNRAVREVSGLRQIWFAPGEIRGEGHYWPLVYTSFWLEHRLWGTAAAGYHVVNVLLHLANTLLLWRLLRRLAVPGAWLVAAVFALHPVRVESVAWVIERKDVLSGLLYLAAAAVWIRAGGAPRPGRSLAALALYVAGLLSKSVVVTLPVALLIWRWWKRGRVTAADLLRLVPFFLVGAAISAADLVFNRSRGVGGLGYSLVERALIAARALWFYLGKNFWPMDLGIVYPRWEVAVADPLAWAGLVAAIALVAKLWSLRDRIGRGPLAGVLFFGVTLAPTLGFVDYNYMLFSFVADRFQYLAGIGVLAVVIGAAAHGLAQRPGPGSRLDALLNVVLVAALLGGLGTLTWRQADNYRDGITFFRYLIAHNPQAREAHLNLGSALLRHNRLEEALAAYRVAEQQRPDDCKPPYGAGLALYHLGRPEEAEAAYLRALQTCPHYAGALAALSELRLDQQRHHEALELAHSAIGHDSGNAKAWTSRGRALQHLGRTEEALEALNRALALDPNRHQALRARAQLLRDSPQGGQ